MKGKGRPRKGALQTGSTSSIMAQPITQALVSVICDLGDHHYCSGRRCMCGCHREPPAWLRGAA